MTIKVLDTNTLAASGTSLSGSKVASGHSVDSLVSDFLGQRCRFVRTYYIHATSSGSITQNDRLDVYWAAAEQRLTLSPGTYDAAGLAAEIQTQLQTLSASFACTADADGHFTISHTTTSFDLLWNTGTDAAVSCGTTIGFLVAADDTGASTYTSDNVADGMGHFVLATMTTGSGMDGFAFYRPRWTSTFNESTVMDTEATTYRPDGDTVKVFVYSHTSDLGDDPRLWSDSATLEATLSFAFVSKYEPYLFNELFVQLPSATTTSQQYYYFHISHGTAQANIAQLELGLLYAGTATQTGSLNNRTLAAEHQRRLVLPGKTLTAHSGALFRTERLPYWEIDVVLDAWESDNWNEYLRCHQDFGARLPRIWVLDASNPNAGNQTSWFATIKGSLALDLAELDYGTTTITLRQHR